MGKVTVANRPSRKHDEFVRMDDGRVLRNKAFVGKKKRISKTVAVSDIVQQSVKRDKPDKQSAIISRMYAHLSIANGHMHNGSGVGNDLERMYYASPQGRMELDRRSRGNKYGNNDYADIAEKIDNGDYMNPSQDMLNQCKLDELISKGASEVRHEFANQDQFLAKIGGSRNRGENSEIRHWTVERSAEWLNKLSTDEQDAVCELTSNGFENMKRAIGEGDESLSFFEFDRPPEDHLEVVKDAIDKAPVVDPFICYRGTSMSEVADILGISDDEMIEIYDSAANGELGNFSGRIADDDSRINKIPESLSVTSDNAKRFDKKAFLEIEMQTSASPANVSAWGPAETEFLSNPNSKYEVVSLRKVIVPREDRDRNDESVIMSLREIRQDD